MKRRQLLGITGAGLLTASTHNLAQPASTARIGWLSADLSGGTEFLDAFRAGMRELGYAEERNLVIDARWGERSAERVEQLAAALVASKPQLIITQATFALKRAGATMPVVFGFSGDPVEAKLVQSLGRPGGNFTGMAFLSLELAGKRMQLTKELMPRLKRIAIVCAPEHAGQPAELQVSQAAAKALDIGVDYFPVRSAADIDAAFAAMRKSGSEAAMVFPDALTARQRDQIAALAAKSRIPAVSGWALYADAGFLFSYGPNLYDSFRRLAYYADRILKGANPAELPVEQPATFEMVLNLKTAKALGLKVPQSILIQATKVIE